MQQLLDQIKEESNMTDIPKEWAQCLKSVQMVIEQKYLSIEKLEMMDFAWKWHHQWSKEDSQAIIPFFDNQYK